MIHSGLPYIEEEIEIIIEWNLISSFAKSTLTSYRAQVDKTSLKTEANALSWWLLFDAMLQRAVLETFN